MKITTNSLIKEIKELERERKHLDQKIEALKNVINAFKAVPWSGDEIKETQIDLSKSVVTLNKRKPFTSFDDDYIVTHYHAMKGWQIGRQLNRTAPAIMSRAKFLREQGRLTPKRRGSKPVVFHQSPVSPTTNFNSYEENVVN